MIELRIYNTDYTGYQSVDLFEDEPIYYELSFAEIQDISKKNSGFTKTFNIPGTEKNNRFFNHFYDPSVVSTSFDTRIKHNASLNYNGYEIAVGYIRLEKVTKDRSGIIYTVIFYNQVGDLVSKMGDKKLNELVTDGTTGNDALDHTMSRNNIYSSWNYNTSTPASGLLGGKILYPLLHRGYAYSEIAGSATALEVNPEYTGFFNASGVQTDGITRPTYIPTDPNIGYIHSEYFSPSIQLTTLFKLILNDNGYRLESNFFDENPWVKRVYLPTTYASEDYGLVQIPNETWDVLESTFTLNNTFVNHQIVYSQVISDEYNRWITTDTFQPALPGWHLYEVEFNVENTGTGQRDIDLVIYRPTGGLTYDIGNFTVAGGDKGNFTFRRWINLSTDDPHTLFFVTTAGSTNNCVFTDVNFRQLKSTRYGAPWTNDASGPWVNMNTQLGDQVSQLDIISSTLKQFNLIMVPKVNDENTLIVEPFNEWVGTGDIIDWTTKVNRETPIQITDTTKFINGVIDLKPNQGKDFLNENYSKENRLSFGQREELLSTDYKEKKIGINSIFSISQQELVRPTSDYTLPVFYQAKDENINGENVRIFSTFETTPTLIYYAGLRNIYDDRGVYMNYYKGGYSSGDNQLPQKVFPQSHHLTYYPVVTATQNKSISFNKDQRQGTYKQITVHQDCYTMFYEDVVQDYLSDESRFMSCELYLEPEEVKKLDFSEQIIIDNARWRINKLSSIDMTKPSLIKGEFVKLYQDFQRPGDVDFDMIELISCSGRPSIYTTTSLNPDLVILTGMIVKVNGYCYYVSPPAVYDPTKTYTQVTLDNNNGIPYTFPYCSDCGETGGGLCEPITDILPVQGSGGILLGIYSDFTPGDPPPSPRPDECVEERYYWDCTTNLFTTETVAYYDSCTYPVGWSNVSGTAMVIPTPVNRSGFLVEECCYDPNTGFNFDIYSELVNGEMIIHKICCDTQPTTTTSTTAAPEYYFYRVEECENPEGFYIIQTTQVINIGQAVKISINPDGCYEVTQIVEPTTPTATLLQVFADCTECSTTTTTTTSSPTTTTTTTVSQLCKRYQATAPTMSGESLGWEYIDCQGNPQTDILYWGESSVTFCALDGTVIADNQGITEIGLC